MLLILFFILGVTAAIQRLLVLCLRYCIFVAVVLVLVLLVLLVVYCCSDS